MGSLCSWRCAEVFGLCAVLALQEGATWPSAHAYASQVFWSSAAAAQLAPQQTEQPTPPQEQQPQQQWPHKPTLQLQLFSWDGGPRPMPSGADLQQHNSRVKTLRVTVSDIRSRSPAHPGMALGSVLYMDSFAGVSGGVRSRVWGPGGWVGRVKALWGSLATEVQRCRQWGHHAASGGIPSIAGHVPATVQLVIDCMSGRLKRRSVIFTTVPAVHVHAQQLPAVPAHVRILLHVLQTGSCGRRLPSAPDQPDTHALPHQHLRLVGL